MNDTANKTEEEIIEGDDFTLTVRYCKPPNWSELEEKFGVKWENTVVAYGDACYTARRLLPDVPVHEAVHIRQQAAIEGGAPVWWHLYMNDPMFRLRQEIEAYQSQWRWLLQYVRDRNLRARRMMEMAQDLSGSMYGNVISYTEAIEIIRNDDDIGATTGRRDLA